MTSFVRVGHRRSHLALATILGLAITFTPAAGAQSSFGGPVIAPTPVPTPTPSVPPGGDVSDPDPAPSAIVEQIYSETNAARAAAGVAPVRRMLAVEVVAQKWSERQAAEDRMYHNPNLKTELPATWREYGENVLQNWNGVDGKALVRQWLNSPPHRSNLLNPMHRDIGAGVAVAPSGKLYSTQVFAAFR